MPAFCSSEAVGRRQVCGRAWQTADGTPGVIHAAQGAKYTAGEGASYLCWARWLELLPLGPQRPHPVPRRRLPPATGAPSPAGRHRLLESSPSPNMSGSPKGCVEFSSAVLPVVKCEFVPT